MQKLAELVKELSKYNDVLKKFTESGMMLPDSVREEIMKSKQSAVLKLHPYAITAPTHETGRWQTYIKTENARRTIRARSKDQVTNITCVVEHTKTNSDRFVVLVPAAMEIIKRIPHNDDEYMFVRMNGKRIKSKDVATVLEKYAKVNGTTVKSTHKIRKTYASMLNAAGVPLDAIREELGHTNLSTTLSYLYNPLTDEETYSLIQKAL
ncbi:MAG: tyrosine-type recombinase/integrase [Lachnospiraceae bacterium]|nr:tyrosine-type recombinase/integrase [Lachnospiraceae bacterium]